MVDKKPFTELEIFHRGSLAVAITTYYPEYNNSTSSDRVRGDLAIELAKNSLNQHFKLSVVDGGSHPDFIEKLNSLGYNAIPQKNSGIDESRFQTYKEAVKYTGVNVIAWVEAEKAPLVSAELWQAALLILSGKVKVIVPGRSDEGFDSLPQYQRQSERSANSILETTLAKHNIPSPNIDWFFGPKMFHKSLIAEFTNETPFWEEFRNQLKTQKPDLAKWYGYTSPLILPVVYALYKGIPTVGYEMKSYRHPESQTQIELRQKEIFLKRRLGQLEKINLAVDFFCQYLRQK